MNHDLNQLRFQKTRIKKLNTRQFLFLVQNDLNALRFVFFFSSSHSKKRFFGRVRKAPFVGEQTLYEQTLYQKTLFEKNASKQIKEFR
jgi:hypothetical protein